MIFRFIARALLSLSGWKYVDRFATVPKHLVILAPHTSNWDFVILWLTKIAFGYSNVKGLGKQELFKHPVSAWFFSRVGLIPVDRSKPKNLVRELVKAIKSEDNPPTIFIAPEGTRAWTPGWKSGFYFLAREASIPITCLSLDYKSKTVEFGAQVAPSDNIESDLRKIEEYFQDKVGRNPDQESPINIQAMVAKLSKKTRS